MTYEELLINIELNGHENVLPTVGKKCFYDKYWFVVCDDGDCHLFDKNGRENDIKKVKTIYKDMISKDIKKIVIPNNVTCIWHYTFSYCRLLTSVTIGNNVTSIGNSAFFDCNSLMNITISNSVTNIGPWAFCDCFKLTSVTIPNSVMNIRYNAFDGCSNLASVTIPDNITSIGEQAFIGCSNLKSLIFKNKSLEQIKSMDNYPWKIKDESIIKCI